MPDPDARQEELYNNNNIIINKWKNNWKVLWLDQR